MATRERVRATLLKLPGVLDVLIDDRVVFQMKPGATLDVGHAKRALKEHEVASTTDQKIDGFRFATVTR